MLVGSRPFSGSSKEMKDLLKKVFSVFGVGVYRLPPAQNGHGQQPPRLVVTSALAHNSKEGLNAFYADQEVAESYLDVEFYPRLVNLLSEKTNYDGKSIADVGCGAGHLLNFIQERFRPASLTGFEYVEAALAIAQSRVPAAQIKYLNIYDGSDQTFDVVFCIEVLEHLQYPARALSNVIRMIADSGTALITVPNGRTDTFEGHINFWSPESWSVFVNEICQGFEVTTGLLENGQCNFAIIKSKK